MRCHLMTKMPVSVHQRVVCVGLCYEMSCTDCTFVWIFVRPVKNVVVELFLSKSGESIIKCQVYNLKTERKILGTKQQIRTMGRWSTGMPVSFPLQWHFSPRLAHAAWSHGAAGHSERTREKREARTVAAKT